MKKQTIAIVGGGITGLSAADELTRKGYSVTVFEKEATLGGLAGSFKVGEVYLERFYHHIFTTDTAIAEVIHRLGLGNKLEWQPTTNSYYADKIYRLSKPTDLLKFSSIGLVDRFRLGLLYLKTIFVKDWRPLEKITAKAWLIQMAGEKVYRGVWEPLLRGKFGRFAESVSAVWIWNKLKLRGSSRGKQGEERLGYLRGGFGQVITAWQQELEKKGVVFFTSSPVEEVVIVRRKATGVRVKSSFKKFDLVLVTQAPEIFSSIAALPGDYAEKLNQIKYLGNLCLLISLDRPLSDTYWLNVGDPKIPFTGVIEHTNFQRPSDYGGAYLAYLSRYIDTKDPDFKLDAESLLASYLPHLKKMYKGFTKSWVKDCWLWKEKYAQPIIGLNYSKIKPSFTTPVSGLWYSSMAHIYPEDRGMNYAVLFGQKVAAEIASLKQIKN